MSNGQDSSFLDGIFMRIVAGLVIVACVGALAYLNRDRLAAKPEAAEAKLNPQFVKCRDTRVGHVEKNAG